MVHKKKGSALISDLFIRSNVKWSITPMWLKKFCHILSENCSIHGKTCEIFGPYNSWTSVKGNIADVWNWSFGLWKLKWGDLPPPAPVYMLTYKYYAYKIRVQAYIKNFATNDAKFLTELRIFIFCIIYMWASFCI